MTAPIQLDSILVGDELGQLKLIKLATSRVATSDWSLSNTTGSLARQSASLKNYRQQQQRCNKNTIVQVYDECLQFGPSAARAIVSMRPIQSIHEAHLDSTSKPNHLFLIANKVGQLFICDTNNIVVPRTPLSVGELHHWTDNDYDNSDDNNDDDVKHARDNNYYGLDGSTRRRPILTPVYFNLESDNTVCGAQPINQSNVLVIYQNGNIQHIDISQDVLQSSLGIKRKAIKLLGLGHSNDSKRMHWTIDGRTGQTRYQSYAAHVDDFDPLVDGDMYQCGADGQRQRQRRNAKRNKYGPRSMLDTYQQSPCQRSCRANKQDRLVSAEVLNMLTSRALAQSHTLVTAGERERAHTCSSAWSLHLLYKKLRLYELPGGAGYSADAELRRHAYRTNCFALNGDRLAVAGQNYLLRVYDVQTQKPIFNAKRGPTTHRSGGAHQPGAGAALVCPKQGEHESFEDIDWIGGNRTTRTPPSMIATCTGVNSIVKIYDIRQPKLAFNLDLTSDTDTVWEPYDNCTRGSHFMRICSSAAPISTAVPSQQLGLGSTNGEVHILDLRFIAKSHRLLGRLDGFCGGEIRDVQFVSESFELSKLVSCASDRFVRVHKIQTSFTSVVSHKASSKIFVRSKPTCMQPICVELPHYNYDSMDDYELDSCSLDGR